MTRAARRASRQFGTVTLALLLGACATHNGPTIYDDPSAIAVLTATSGSSVHGVVTFVRMARVTLVNTNFAGFQPNSKHRIQFYERGDCSARDGSSAGAPFNPGPAGKASAKRSSGDLGTFTADAKGELYEKFELSDAAFGSGPDSIIGRGLIVLAAPAQAQLTTAAQPPTRQACGVITRNADRMTYAQAAARAPVSPAR